MVNVFESTLEGTSGEVIVSSGIGSQTPCSSLDSASERKKHLLAKLVVWGGGGRNRFPEQKRRGLNYIYRESLALTDFSLRKSPWECPTQC